MTSPPRHRSAAILAMLSVLMLAPAVGAAEIDPLPTRALFDFADDRDNLVIEYTMRHDELAENDPIPMLRIYGDGTVNVHVPTYWKGAGDYRMTLSETELRGLIESFAARGVLDFDAEQVERAKDAAENARRNREGTEIHISDNSWTLIRVRLDSYDPMGTGLTADALDRRIKWANVDWHAEHYPGVSAFRGLAEAQQTLYDLVQTAQQTPALGEEK